LLLRCFSSQVKSSQHTNAVQDNAHLPDPQYNKYKERNAYAHQQVKVKSSQAKMTFITRNVDRRLVKARTRPSSHQAKRAAGQPFAVSVHDDVPLVPVAHCIDDRVQRADAS